MSQIIPNILQTYSFYLPYMKEVQIMCLPFLSQYKIDHFWYSRIYSDGSLIDIGLDPAWFEYMLVNNHFDLLHESKLFLALEPEKEVRLMSTTKESLSRELISKKLTFIVEKYKIFYTFNIIINKGEYLENFAFSAPPEHPEIISVYTRHFGVLKAFGRYFTEKAASLIKDIELKGKILSPPVDYNESKIISSLIGNQSPPNDWVNNNIKHFFLSTPKGDMAITPRQKQCLSLLAQGMNYKEISRILTIDIKTVEHHMQKLRDKTGLTLRSKLIQAFIESGL